MAVALVAALVSSASVHAQEATPTPTPSPNLQVGNNTSRTTQSGTSKSGDAVGGQVAGVNSNGNTSVNAQNNTSDTQVTSGDANGTNSANSFVGLEATNHVDQTATPPGAEGSPGAFADAAAVAQATNSNLQTGDNTQTLRQTATATSGDAVGGEVIGAVTGAGGSSTIVGRNTTANSDITSGDATSSNNATAFTGLLSEASASALAAATAFSSTSTGTTPGAPAALSTAVASSTATALATATAVASNVQNGDNRSTINQAAPSTTGDAVGGQVIGAVSSGASSIDATNTTRDSSVTSGDATSTNSSDSFTGLLSNANAVAAASALASSTAGSFALPSGTAVATATSAARSSAVGTSTAANNQIGSNRATVTQSAPASSGDAVGGEVIGAVTSAGGASSIVAANDSERVDVTSGDATSNNSSAAFSGEQANGNANARSAANAIDSASATAGCVVSCFATHDTATATTNGLAAAGARAVGGALNTQNGDNRATVSQTAPASSGDAVGGQVIGAVTAGRSAIDARNSSVDTSVTSGDATSMNTSTAFSGLQSNGVANGSATATTHNRSGALALGFGDFDSASAIANSSGLAAMEASAFGGAANDQTGLNRATLTQQAPATSGDAVGGEVIGAVTSAGGSSSIVGRNTSDRVDVTSGDANSTNISNLFSGNLATGTANALASGAAIDSSSAVNFSGGLFSPSAATARSTSEIVESGALSDGTGRNVQVGDNRATASQAAPASSGDAVGGQVVGAVASGTSVIDAANTSRDSSVVSGDANSTNISQEFAGLGADGQANAVAEALASSTASSLINNLATVSPTVASSRGDSVVLTESLVDGFGANNQTGSNRATLTQSAPASTGDAVGGEVIGAVTSAGGSTRIIGANTSDRVDVKSGDATSTNNSGLFVGDAAAGAVNAASSGDAVSLSRAAAGCDGCLFSPTTATATSTSFNGTLARASGSASNDQTGDNRGTLTQSAPASSGDAVGGQVIGAVSAGATSIDARNSSVDSSVTSGDATSVNNSEAFVGDAAQGAANAVATGTSISRATAIAIASADFNTTTSIAGAVANTRAISQADGSASNAQLGDNGLRVTQTAPASTGDGVAGEVIGVVTSAGGSARVVAANRSEGDDVTSGDALSTNDSRAFAGLTAAGVGTAVSSGTAIASSTAMPAPVTITDLLTAFASATAAPSSTAAAQGLNQQTGDNRFTITQLAPASSGDAVAGQIVGVVSAGAASLDASNASTDSTVKSGDARSHNDSNATVGESSTPASTAVSSAFALATSTPATEPAFVFTPRSAITGAAPKNLQQGDNNTSVGQSASATTGDAVAGQIAGVVTSAGGNATGVLANTSNGIDSRSGDSRFDNIDVTQVGLFAAPFRLSIP